ncbi:TonB family protein [Paraburkholderia silvatlantica]|uniref:Protein TonB n=1 Tax=Paraburkholderia silvatlantica TaxID=321895 RepID=A0ABR6FPC8_9BURK|nr:TonB family protein [Paraburkholderia silvatlantica]MBB2929277.1 protein TonB [Paraburkholderia silvatlantica]PVY27302.1 outer membrane transport energization protein TonB [Paraburkholderia silvatlantica]PXW34331.1 outer membrane transport energization protein TonB [Paraburkholderia silvatlantica]TDQ85227.1 outer membrane transport energization protein TonB [Paraburkholderia silvatlantica]
MATLSTARLAPEKRRLYGAAAVALIVEMALLAGAWSMLRQKSAEPPPKQPPTLLSLASVPAPQPAPAAPPVPKPQAPHPQVQRPQPHAAPPLRHVAHAAAPQPVHAPQQSAPSPSPTPAPAPAAALPEPAQPPAPAPAPVAAPAPARVSASFESALRAAIEAALHYPESARMAGISGRTRVAFQYRDGVVSGATVAVSSGVAALDRAALAAVRDADVPKPESGFAGKTLTEQLWVNFNLDAQQ